MIITEYVTCRGKKKHISELGKANRYKVDVQCPKCGQIRNVYYRSILKAGHDICQACMMKKQSNKLPIGQRFGELVVIGHSEKSGMSICLCDCGNVVEKINRNLYNGITKSCGCLKKENFDNTTRVKGEAHGMWKGGISDERSKLMSKKVYKDWRKKVYERDNFTCQKCGQVGYKLNCHHIENYAGNKEKACCLENGITFCKTCHQTFHALYGRKNTTKQMLDEFMSSK